MRHINEDIIDKAENIQDSESSSTIVSSSELPRGNFEISMHMLGEIPVISKKSISYIEAFVEKLRYIDNVSFDVTLNGNEHIDLT